MTAMTAIERAVDLAQQRAVLILLQIGQQLRQARVTRGLSQATAASAAGLTQAQVSRIERGLYPGVTIAALARLASVLGLELSLKLYPAGQPLRDKAHVALFERLRAAVGSAWAWSAEVPLPIPGDKRAWDRRIDRPGIRIGLEGETRPTDMQELARRVALKKRDGGVDRLILVLADTDWCRRVVRLNDLSSAFPIPGRTALKALADGRDPGGDAVILV